MKVQELIDKLKPYADFDLQVMVHVRMIDADDLTETITALEKEGAEYISLHDLRKLIRRQPTILDLEHMIEQLEEIEHKESHQGVVSSNTEEGEMKNENN